MYIGLLSLIAIAALWLYRDHRQTKQIRCLRYCFVDMSEWANQKLRESNAGEDFGRRLQYHRSLMNRAGVDPLTEADLLYANEDVAVAR